MENLSRNKDYEAYDIQKAEIEIELLVQGISKIYPNINERWLAIAKTHFEQGFMAFERAVRRAGLPF